MFKSRNKVPNLGAGLPRSQITALQQQEGVPMAGMLAMETNIELKLLSWYLTSPKDRGNGSEFEKNLGQLFDKYERLQLQLRPLPNIPEPGADEPDYIAPYLRSARRIVAEKQHNFSAERSDMRRKVRQGMQSVGNRELDKRDGRPCNWDELPPGEQMEYMRSQAHHARGAGKHEPKPPLVPGEIYAQLKAKRPQNAGRGVTDEMSAAWRSYEAFGTRWKRWQDTWVPLLNKLLILQTHSKVMEQQRARLQPELRAKLSKLYDLEDLEELVKMGEACLKGTQWAQYRRELSQWVQDFTRAGGIAAPAGKGR